MSDARAHAAVSASVSPTAVLRAPLSTPWGFLTSSPSEEHTFITACANLSGQALALDLVSCLSILRSCHTGVCQNGEIFLGKAESSPAHPTEAVTSCPHFQDPAD